METIRKDTFEEDLTKVSSILRTEGYTEKEIDKAISLLRRYKKDGVLKNQPPLEALKKVARSSIENGFSINISPITDKIEATELVKFYWDVAEEYEIITVDKLSERLYKKVLESKLKDYAYKLVPAEQANENSELLISPVEGKTWRPFEPRKNESLHLRLAKVNPDDHKSILKFVNKFGTLGLKYRLGETIRPLVDSLKSFQREVRTVNCLVNILNKIKKGEKDTNKAPRLEDIYQVDGTYNFGVFIEDNYFLECQNPPVNPYSLSNYLMSTIIKRLRIYNVYPSAEVTPEKIIPKYNADNLIGAVYLQLYYMATNRLSYKSCHLCNSLFILHRSDKEICTTCKEKLKKRRQRKKEKGG